MAKILGIDLGTTNSAMAVIEGGEPKILENHEGNRTTPSIVAVSKENERLAGLLAKRQAVVNPKNTIFSIKRLIGRKFSDEEVQRDKSWFPFDIQESDAGGVEIKMSDRWYKPEEISAMVLAKIKADTEAKLGEKIKEAVITGPPAAALAYGLNKKKNEKIVVYDFGGGTFDVSVLEVGGDTVEVKATGGDTHLGGDDFDQRVIEWIVQSF